MSLRALLLYVVSPFASSPLCKRYEFYYPYVEAFFCKSKLEGLASG